MAGEKEIAGTSEMAEEIAKEESLGSLLLWIGVLTGPSVWAIQLGALYMLEEFVSCTAGSETQGVILGFDIRVIAVFVTVVLAAATVLAGLASYSCLRKVRAQDDPTPERRAEWMAVAGIMSSILFLVIILIKLPPPLMLGVCQGQP